MGIAIKISDATFTKYIGIAEFTEDDPVIPDVPDTPDEPTVPDTYPVTGTLKGLYYLGDTVDKSLVDHSGNSNNATAVGTITCTDGYATFTGAGTANRIDTHVNVPYGNKVTAVALFRVPTGTRSIVSNYKGNSNYGFVLTNSRVYATATVASNGGNKVFTAINSNNFAICAISVDTSSVRVVRDLGGAFKELLDIPLDVAEWTQAITIGGYLSNISYNDDADIALVSIHEGDVSDTQLKQIFAYVRNYGESKGLTIE